MRTFQCISLVIISFSIMAYADKGYDKEENPTGAYDAYCVQLQYNFELGLCQGIGNTVNVCAVTAESPHPLSAFSWLNREVMPKGSPVMDKTIIQGDVAYDRLQQYFHQWVCKQVDPLSTPATNLNAQQLQNVVCGFQWRRDQEIQKQGSPTPGAPWGVFTYQPAGGVPTSFTFKGAPLNQCENNYDCRTYNNPGNVFVCCDYCEQYFNTYCTATSAQITKFCMEQAQCVCNSVLKPCYNKYPVYGAPCSAAYGYLVPSLMSWVAPAVAIVISSYALLART